MPRLSSDLKQRVLATINSWGPYAIDDYLKADRDEDGKLKSDMTDGALVERAKKLAIALDKLSQTKSTKASESQIRALELNGDEEIKLFISLMDNPANVSSLNLQIRSCQNEVKDILSSRLAHFARIICSEYGVDASELSANSEPQNTSEDDRYIISLSDELENTNALNKERYKTLDYIRSVSNVVSLGCFSLADRMFPYIAISSLFDSEHASQGMQLIVGLYLAGVALFIIPHIVVGLVLSAVYGGAKLVDSFAKIGLCSVEPIKALRGAVRAGLIMAGSGASIYAGLIAGVTLATVIPGFNVFFGMVLGALVCGSLGLGLAAFLSKQMIRFVSWLVNSNAVNPTNPARYQLSNFQRERLENFGIDITVLNELLRELKAVKADVPFLSQLYSSDAGTKLKDKINLIIEDLKNGVIDKSEVSLNDKQFMLFKNVEAAARFTRDQGARMSAYQVEYPSIPDLELAI